MVDKENVLSPKMMCMDSLGVKCHDVCNVLSDVSEEKDR